MADLIGGFYPKPRNPNAPDFVICKASINIPQFREFMQAFIKDNPGEDWINMDCLLSKAGKGYAVIDNWKPEGRSEGNKAKEDIPF